MKNTTHLTLIFPLLTFSFLTLLILPESTQAVPPPDFLFNVGSQIAQFSSIAAIFLSAIFATMYKFIKVRLDAMGSKKIIVWIVAVVAIAGISLGGAYAYGKFKQNEEYEKWLTESQKYASLPQEQAEYLKKIPRDLSEKEDYKKIPRDLDIDQLKIDKNENMVAKFESTYGKFSSTIKDPDESTKFIENYYKNIANSEYEAAYEVSKKSTSLETFKSWYVNTTKIILDKVSRIDDVTSSLELTLYEGDVYTRYGVLMELKLENSKPVRIANSTVKILDEGTLIIEEISPTTDSDTTISTTNKVAQSEATTSSFFENNKNYPIKITNKEFNKIINNGKADYIILDAREDLEYDNGYLSNSKHIRFADLKAGKWIELPEDKYIYVICWSGIRGKEVADFLRTKNLVASYLENGANGWVEWGGDWTGNIKFSEKYESEKYKKIFTTSEVKKKVANGVVLVDSREPWKFEDSKIPGSVNIPIMYTPSINLEDAFAQVPPNSTVITICDGYVNCFDAKITAVELEHRGHTFIGRYNKPWEYE